MTRPRVTRGWLLPLVCLALLTMPAFSGAGAETSQERRTDQDRTATAAARDDGREESDTVSDEKADATQNVSSPQSSAATAAGHKGKVIETGPRNVSPLVKAAAAASSKKKATRRFTDADLAGAKGKLIIVEGTNVREPEIIPIEERSPEAVSPVANEPAEQVDEARRHTEMKALRKEIAELEVELRRLEEDYYLIEQEDHREEVEKSFAEARRSLDEKRERLRELESGGRS